MRKGQTALEYLITYGWAILIILVVLAVLWYYGIFNPSTWAGEKVVDGTDFRVVDHRLSSSQLVVIIGNKAGNDLEVNAISVSGAATGANATLQNVSAGGEITYSMDLVGLVGDSGDLKNLMLHINYDDLRTGLSDKNDTAILDIKIQ